MYFILIFVSKPENRLWDNSSTALSHCVTSTAKNCPYCRTVFYLNKTSCDLPYRKTPWGPTPVVISIQKSMNLDPQPFQVSIQDTRLRPLFLDMALPASVQTQQIQQTSGPKLSSIRNAKWFNRPEFFIWCLQRRIWPTIISESQFWYIPGLITQFIS